MIESLNFVSLAVKESGNQTVVLSLFVFPKLSHSFTIKFRHFLTRLSCIDVSKWVFI
jgi:hypothetical protein